jgi:hypothetical protein
MRFVGVKVPVTSGPVCPLSEMPPAEASATEVVVVVDVGPGAGVADVEATAGRNLR